MAVSTKHNADGMARPPAEQPKTAVLNFRVHAEVREAVERFARDEHRSLAAMSDLLVREALIARLEEAGENASRIRELP